MKLILNLIDRVFQAFIRYLMEYAYSRPRFVNHYPGTAGFVPPWRRGKAVPSHPNEWRYVYVEEYSNSGGYEYCVDELERSRVDADVRKPRATRE